MFCLLSKYLYEVLFVKHNAHYSVLPTNTRDVSINTLLLVIRNSVSFLGINSQTVPMYVVVLQKLTFAWFWVHLFHSNNLHIQKLTLAWFWVHLFRSNNLHISSKVQAGVYIFTILFFNSFFFFSIEK